MSIKVGINGFGRIGRHVLRAGSKRKELEFVAVNDLTDAKTLAHLLKYDSTFGPFPGTVEVSGTKLKVDGREIEVLSERDPSKLPWKGVDLVVESTGRFTDAEKAKAHLAAGAGRVIISAPGKNEDITVCMGINEGSIDPEKHKVISNASCTTNCLAPMAKVLDEAFGLESGFMTTIHSYTNDQVILDFPHKDLRRARAAGLSMIPTSTGAAKAVGKVLPGLAGRLTGIAIRVPTPDVSVVDLTARLKKAATKEQVNEAFRSAASSGPLKGFLAYSEEPLVSMDFKGNPASCVFDAPFTDAMDGGFVKILGWYDNEWGYANRVVDLAAYLAKKAAVRA